jgi:hypothetical protein
MSDRAYEAWLRMVNATPGPWGWRGRTILQQRGTMIEILALDEAWPGGVAEGDREFIRHAWEDIRWLLLERKRLREALARLATEADIPGTRSTGSPDIDQLIQELVMGRGGA